MRALEHALLAVLLCAAAAVTTAHRRGGGGGGGSDDETTVTEAEVEEVRRTLRNVIVGRLTAHVIRAVFHDSVGGMDGCLNRNVPQNSGPAGPENFMNIVGVLDNVYKIKYVDSGLSTADFYVLAGEVALERSFIRAQRAAGNCYGWFGCYRLFKEKLNLNFTYGREDCLTSPVTEDQRPFPNGHLGTQGAFAFYADEYGMDVEEAVAISGCHTLGRATGASGWCGIWTGDEEEEIRFDNEYYSVLVNPNITFEQIFNPGCAQNDANLMRYQWNGTLTTENGEEKTFLMLNADVAMLKNISVPDLNNAEVNCTFAECPDSDGAPYVRRFAESNDAFYASFAKAWQTMVTANTNGELRQPERKRRWGGGRWPWG